MRCFDRVPSESRPGRGEDSGSTASADPLYIYYRSMSKIPLLTREEEVYLAKKIETAKVNTLRLLSLTPVFTRLLLENPEEIQPAPPQTAQGVTAETRELEPIEERNRLRARAVRKITGRLEKLEEKYRFLKADLERGSRQEDRERKLKRIKTCRASVARGLRAAVSSTSWTATKVLASTVSYRRFRYPRSWPCSRSSDTPGA